MTETHLAVVTNPDDFPMTNKGNPKVGHFPYGEENIFTETWEEIITLEDIPAVAEDILYIAAQAVVEEVTCFDGTTGVTVEDTVDFDIDGSITVEALVKVEDSVDGKFYTIVGKWNDRDGSNRAWLLGMYNLLPCFYISTNGTNFQRAIVDSGNELNIGQWYHLKGTFDAATGKIEIYVDDILENTNDTSFGNININLEPVLIGGDRAGGGKGAFFNGCIYEVKVWGEYTGEGEFPVLVELEWPELVTEESAWAVDGEEPGEIAFPGNNWATYFDYTVQLPQVGMVLWLDAGKGITDASGVSKWEDQSGSGNDAEQGDTDKQPTYEINGSNGKAVVRFDGSNDFLITENVSLGNSISVFAVVEAEDKMSPNDHDWRYNQGIVTQYKDGRYILEINSTAIRFQFYDGDWITADADATCWQLYGVIREDSFTKRLYLNGVEAASKNTSTGTSGSNNPIKIGFSGDYSRYLKGDIAEILVYDRVLSDSERDMVQTYLNIKYVIY